jgi:hypothetical protein
MDNAKTRGASSSYQPNRRYTWAVPLLVSRGSKMDAIAQKKGIAKLGLLTDGRGIFGWDSTTKLRSHN